MARRASVIAVLVLGLATVGASDCDEANTKEAQSVDQQQQKYVDGQPAPMFDWSLERHVMVELYKARNEAVATYSYVQSPYTGKVLWSCPSVGFPIPANVQLTNPEKWVNTGVALPQAEPNGLYTSPSTHGTYVMCVDTAGGITPRYEERDVMAALQPLQEVNGALVPIPGKPASITISIPKRK